jgi:hypothetical protein
MRFILFCILAIIALIFLCLSLWKKNLITVALISGVALLMCGLALLGAPHAFAILYALPGTVYPLMLCGMVWFADNSCTHKMRWLCLLLIFIVILMHLPRFLGARRRYAGKGLRNSQQQFLRKELDTITQIVGKDKLTVDIDNVYYALPILVEFGRGRLNLQWTSRSWKAVVGYRPWPAPSLDVNKRFWLQRLDDVLPRSSCKIIYKTIQYQLVDCATQK